MVCSLTPPHGGARIPQRTLSQVTCCSLTPAPIHAGHELPPSQSLDANQSINNGPCLWLLPFTTLLGTDTGQSGTKAAHQCPGVESSFVHFCKKQHPPTPIHPTRLILLVSPVCGQEDAVLLLGSLRQLPPLLLVLLLLSLWRSPPYNGRRRKK